MRARARALARELESELVSRDASSLSRKRVNMKVKDDEDIDDLLHVLDEAANRVSSMQLDANSPHDEDYQIVVNLIERAIKIAEYVKTR